MDTAARGRTASNPEYRELASALIDISEHIRRASHVATGYHPLPNGMLEILRLVEKNPGINVVEVASRLGRQLSNVSTQLKNLVAKGLVTRSRDAGDKRYVVLHATAEAHRIKTLFEDSWADALVTATERLLPEEQEQLLGALLPLMRLASNVHPGD